jgi:hypothetical protein
LVTGTRTGQIFFASLRFGAFALKSARLIEWIRISPEKKRGADIAARAAVFEGIRLC